MANGWIEDALIEGLMLGNNWQQEKLKNRIAGLPTDDNWLGTYHDNGSCLDILSAQVGPGVGGILQVVQTDPLVVSDSHSHIPAELTSDCLQILESRIPDQIPLPRLALFSVRKYTLRFIPYGPPREQLTLVLDEVDYLGSPQGPLSASPTTPVHQIEQVAGLLERLHLTRTSDDFRLFHRADYSQQQESNSASTNMPNIGNTDRRRPSGHGSPQAYTQLPHTQLAYGTQVTYAERARDEDNGRQLRSIEPTLAGNTGPKEMPSNQAEAQARLLSLLGRSDKTSFGTSASTTTNQSFNRAEKPSFGASDSIAAEHSKAQSVKQGIQEISSNGRGIASPLVGRPTVRAEEQPPRRPREQSYSRSPEPRPKKKRKLSPPQSESLVSPKYQCSWMDGIVFNSDALNIPVNQKHLLQQKTSWHKPEPGTTGFPIGNIPITILETLGRIADERAAADDASMDSSDEPVDPTPGSLEASNPSELPLPIAESEDEGPTATQVTWSASPTPEPPTRRNVNLGLPPDSSVPHDAAESLDRTIHERQASEERSSPPSPPPPVETLMPMDSDDEMEVSVPRGLGEEFLDSSGPSLNQPTPNPSKTSHIQVVVTPQVHNAVPEVISISSATTNSHPSSNLNPVSSTPIPQATNIDFTSRPVMPRLAQNRPSPEMEYVQTSSPMREIASIQKDPTPARTVDMAQVDATPVEPSREIVMEDFQGPQHHVVDVAKWRSDDPPAKVGKKTSKKKKEKREHGRREIKNVGFGSFGDSQHVTNRVRLERSDSLQRNQIERRSSQISHSPTRITGDRIRENAEIETDNSIQVPKSPSPQAPSSTAKARHSPNISNKPPQVETDKTAIPTSTILPLDPGSLETRVPNSSTREMSPRHRSLYDDPEQAKQETSPSKVDVSSVESDLTIFRRFKDSYPDYTGNEMHFKTQCKQMYQLDLEDKMVPDYQWDDYLIRNRTDYIAYVMECAESGTDPDAYIQFYKRNIRVTKYNEDILGGRASLLRALEELGVVPTAPAPHSPAPISHSPAPTSRSPAPAFRSPAPVSRSPTLASPLPIPQSQSEPQHLPQPPTPKQTTYSLLPRATKSRRSLPWASDRTEGSKPLPRTTSSRPRHSLPTASHPQTQERASSAAPGTPSFKAKNILDRLTSSHLPSVPSARSRTATPGPELTGDPFRDAVFAYRRTTSLTGSKKVDKTKPWPHNLAVRPTIDDVANGDVKGNGKGKEGEKQSSKVDVLKWGDIL